MADVRYFEQLWNDAEPGLEVLPFPEVAKDRLVATADPDGIESAQQGLDRCLQERVVRPTLRNHQRAAIENWVAVGHRGLFEHATGSGKTIPALSCVALAAEESRPVLIVVPGLILLHQWKDEIRNYFGAEVRLLLAGGGYDQWKSGSVLRDHITRTERMEHRSS